MALKVYSCIPPDSWVTSLLFCGAGCGSLWGRLWPWFPEERDLEDGGNPPCMTRMEDAISVAVMFSDVNHKAYHAQTMGRRLSVSSFMQRERELLYST